MPKLDHLDALLQEIFVEGSRCFDVVCRLLYIAPTLAFGVDAISHLCFVARKKTTPILSLLSLIHAGLE